MHDPLQLFASPAHTAADFRTPLMSALLATPRYQLAAATVMSVPRIEASHLVVSTCLKQRTKAKVSSTRSRSAVEAGAAARGALMDWQQAVVTCMLSNSNQDLVSLVDAEGRSAVHYASAAGDTFIVDQLRSAGTDAHLCDRMGRTAAHCAAIGGHVSLARDLIEESTSSQPDVFGHSVGQIVEQQHAVRSCGVPTVTKAGVSQLLAEHVPMGIPVLAKQAAAHLPAMKIWSDPRQLASRLNGSTLSVGQAMLISEANFESGSKVCREHCREHRLHHQK